MRSNQELNPRFTASQLWTHNRGPGGELKNLVANKSGDGKPWTAFSHSGKERNRLFLNQAGERFLNISGLSGADSVLDGRSFVHWDFNRDGKTDIAVVNANQTLLQIFENQSRNENHFIAFRVEGDFSKNAKPLTSSRDAIGTKLILRSQNQSILRTLSCGEGFASQNSRTLLVGIGKHETIESATIHWPSGTSVTVENVPAGKLVTVKESGGSPQIENYSID